MRLAQIARKVKTKPAEIRAFIKDKFEVELDKDPNIKLEDDHVNAVLAAFIVEEEVIEEAPAKVTAVVEEEIEIDPSIDVDLESLKETAEEVVAQIDPVEIPDIAPIAETASSTEETAAKAEKAAEEKRKAVAIKHDEGSEEEVKEENPAAFIPLEVDENAALIKAEVEKLEGLKVVGKIELEDRETKKLMNEEVSLPSADSIEDEIDGLDKDVDTSEFTDLTENADEDEKAAIFAELDAAMAQTNAAKVKKVKKVESPVDEDEDSIYKDRNGIYHFSSEQKVNRKKSMAEKAIRDKARIQKEKKARHYEKNVAPKVKPVRKKKKAAPVAKSKDAEKASKNETKGLWGKFLNWINDRN